MSSRRNAFIASIVVHAVLLGTVLLVPLIFTDTIRLKHDYVEVALIAPPLTRPVVTPPPQPRLVAPKLRPPAPRTVRAEIPLPAPKPLPTTKPEILERRIETPKPVSAPVVRSAGFDRAEAAPAPTPKAVVRTGSFADSSAAPGEAGAPARMVQTGGFGDPNGVAGKGRSDKIVKLASLGSFDLPAGGEGGGGGSDRGTGRSVQSAGFGDLNEKAPGTGGPAGRNTGPIETPVEILFKPRPDYTEATRQLRVEGEVLIRVSFRATGEVRILEVIRPLGQAWTRTQYALHSKSDSSRLPK